MILSRVSFALALAVAVTAGDASAQDRRPVVPGEVVPLPVPSEHTVPPEHPLVTFTSTKEGAILQQWRAGWVSLCKAPCTMPLDPAGRYQIDGPMMMASSPEFRLQPGEARIEASPGSLWVRAAGIGVGSLGALGVTLGAYLTYGCHHDPHDECGQGGRDLSIGILAVSAGVVAAGGLMILGSLTSVNIDGNGALALGGRVRIGPLGLMF